MKISDSQIERVLRAVRERYGDVIPTAVVHSFGCQQNVSDGEKIKGMLGAVGFTFLDEAAEADIIIYNTCAVREHAEERVFGNIGALKHYKEKNKNMIIGIGGCMPQQKHIAERLLKSYPYVDLIFGTEGMYNLLDNLEQVLKSKKRVVDNEETHKFIYEGVPVRRDGKFKAFVPIMYGCDNFCTYCVVPLVRGREKSREVADILAEIQELVAKGYKEITLLGQNVNSYGKTLKTPVSFSALLKMINDIDGDFKIKFMTSHPKDASRELIDTIAACEKVSRQFHLPFQSGNNEILKAMNRGYTIESYLDLIEYAKEKVEGISISSDIIVGFPGESREQFLETLEVVKKVRFSQLFTFIYSKREGTAAANLPDVLQRSKKAEYLNELIAEQNKISFELNKSYIGKTVRILVDSYATTKKGHLAGRTDSGMLVMFPGSDIPFGGYADVYVKEAKNFAVIGEKIN